MIKKLTSKNMTAEINYHGAELKSLIKDGKEYMWQADSKFWSRTSPVLFPVVGQVSGGTYKYNGVEYKMSQHGFARDMDFELVESTDSSCTFLLKSNEETKEKYPFDFELRLGYELTDKGIEVIWDVKNTDEKSLEFSIGAHPGFNCVINKSALRISKAGKPLDSFKRSMFVDGLVTDEITNVALTEGVLKLDDHSFDNGVYILENAQSDRVELLDENGDTVVDVTYDAPLVGIWAPAGEGVPFLCIEPWYGRADKRGYDGELKDREWNNTIKAGDSFKVSYFIAV